jgi:hypothetical protein
VPHRLRRVPIGISYALLGWAAVVVGWLRVDRVAVDTPTVRRWVRVAASEPWMTVTAIVATGCAATVVATRWLGLLGVVRDFSVTRDSIDHVSGGGPVIYSTVGYFRELGFAGGPDHLLTHVDHWAWRVGFFAGVLWMLRLARRVSGYRIGVLRVVGVLIGLGVFVVTGAMHRAVDPTARSERSDDLWLDRLVTLWCGAGVASGLLIGFTTTRMSGSGTIPPAHLGETATLAPLSSSIARAGLQLVVALGGWLLAVHLTRRWIATSEHSDTPRQQLDAAVNP